MFVYKFDVLEALKEAGYNSTRILKEGILSQSAMQKLRENKMVGIKTLEKLCVLLDMQPGNIVKYVETEENQKQFIQHLTNKPNVVYNKGNKTKEG